MFKDLNKRLITSAIYLPLVISVLIYGNTLLICAVFTAALAIMVYESAELLTPQFALHMKNKDKPALLLQKHKKIYIISIVLAFIYLSLGTYYEIIIGKEMIFTAIFWLITTYAVIFAYSCSAPETIYSTI